MMKKLILLFILLSSFAFADIDERKVDVYFANGILTEEEDAIANALLLENLIKQKLGINQYKQQIGKVTYAYNDTHGFGQDITESVYQVLNITEFIEWRDRLLGRYTQSVTSSKS